MNKNDLRISYKKQTLQMQLDYTVRTKFQHTLYAITNKLIASRTRVLLQKPQLLQLLKNFPTFYRTRKLITVFTRVLYWSVSLATTIQFKLPHHTSIRSILILFTDSYLGLHSARFPSGLPTKFLCAFLVLLCEYNKS